MSGDLSPIPISRTKMLWSCLQMSGHHVFMSVRPSVKDICWTTCGAFKDIMGHLWIYLKHPTTSPWRINILLPTFPATSKDLSPITNQLIPTDSTCGLSQLLLPILLQYTCICWWSFVDSGSHLFTWSPWLCLDSHFTWPNVGAGGGYGQFSSVDSSWESHPTIVVVSRCQLQWAMLVIRWISLAPKRGYR